MSYQPSKNGLYYKPPNLKPMDAYVWDDTDADGPVHVRYVILTHQTLGTGGTTSDQPVLSYRVVPPNETPIPALQPVADIHDTGFSYVSRKMLLKYGVYAMKKFQQLCRDTPPPSLDDLKSPDEW